MSCGSFRAIGILLCWIAAPSYAPADADLQKFLATGFRTSEFRSSPETERFTRIYGEGVIASHEAATRNEPFQEFLAILIDRLQKAVTIVRAASESEAARYGRPTRGPDHYKVSQAEGVVENLRWSFARSALHLSTRNSWTQEPSDDAEGPVRHWSRSRLLASDVIPAITVKLFYRSAQPITVSAIYEIQLSYPQLTSSHRAALTAHFEGLYRIATDRSSSRQQVEAAVYEWAWWILATIYYEKGSSSLAKGVITALTGDTFPVQGSGEDIDLVAVRSHPETFREDLVQRFGVVRCESCTCSLGRE